MAPVPPRRMRPSVSVTTRSQRGGQIIGVGHQAPALPHAFSRRSNTAPIIAARWCCSRDFCRFGSIRQPGIAGRRGKSAGPVQPAAVAARHLCGDSGSAGDPRPTACKIRPRRGQRSQPTPVSVSSGWRPFSSAVHWWGSSGKRLEHDAPYRPRRKLGQPSFGQRAEVFTAKAPHGKPPVALSSPPNQPSASEELARHRRAGKGDRLGLVRRSRWIPCRNVRPSGVAISSFRDAS